MVLTVRPEHLQAIQSHAEATYPEECCGLLLGTRQRDTPSETRLVVELWQTDNTWEPEVAEITEADPERANGLTRHRRYWIDPKEILAAQRYARDHQLDLIGVYHSHPDHPAMPSESDRALAWSEYSYLIISVLRGRVQDLLSWNLDGNNQFQPESLVVVPSTPPT